MQADCGRYRLSRLCWLVRLVDVFARHGLSPGGKRQSSSSVGLIAISTIVFRRMPPGHRTRSPIWPE
jgi:hypothetical protein